MDKQPRAFPVQISDCDTGCDGMTLRDYFVASAMTGFCANPNHALTDWQPYAGEDINREEIDAAVFQAYLIADAMLEAREK